MHFGIYVPYISTTKLCFDWNFFNSLRGLIFIIFIPEITHWFWSNSAPNI